MSHYSLRDRFHGCLLGCRLGGLYTSAGLQPARDAYRPWWQIARHAIACLSETGELATLDWLEACASADDRLEARRRRASASEAAIATLPVALYFFDRPAQQHREIERAAQLWLRPGETAEAARLLGTMLGNGLGDRPLFPEAFPEAIAPQVHLVRTSLAEETGLGSFCQQLERFDPAGSRPFARALYCSALRDVRLAVARAVRGERPEVAGAIAGALTGARGASAISILWRARFSEDRELQRASDRLLATWAGVLPGADFDPSRVAIAPARTLQLRPSFRAISQ